MALTRLPLGSPLRLVWTQFEAPATPSQRLHRVYAEYVLLKGKPQHRRKLAARFIVWPFLLAGLIVHFTWKTGRKVKARTGKSLVRMVWEQVHAAVCHSISPDQYFRYELFRPERRARIGEYIPRYELKGALHNLFEHQVERDGRPTTRWIINDKASLGEHLAKAGVNAVRTLLLVHPDGRVEVKSHDRPALPRRDLFVKPDRGKGGRGCERWNFVEDRYVSNDGRERLPEQLLAHLKARARDSGRAIAVQPLVRPHPWLAEVSARTLVSCRIMSLRSENGDFEVTDAVFKMPRKADAIVDNFHAGGIVCSVDLETGRLGPASDGGMTEPCVWFDSHPVTGARIAGRMLPLWAETKALVIAAHRACPDRICVGWDVAISAEGPIIVEGNVQSGFDMIQRTHAPIGNRRAGELLAFHGERCLEGWKRWLRAKSAQAMVALSIFNQVIDDVIQLWWAIIAL